VSDSARFSVWLSRHCEDAERSEADQSNQGPEAAAHLDRFASLPMTRNVSVLEWPG
jgi:hypothetical protein